MPLVPDIWATPSPESVFTEGTTEAPRILVIEDDPVASQLIQSQLTSSGYEVVACMQPERAIEMAAELRPDAITLDVLMKLVDGLQVLLQLKTDPRAVDLLTATDDVSASGFLCNCPMPLAKDSIVEVFLTGTGERYIGRARVVRIQWCDTPRQRYGFRFVEKSDVWIL